MSDSDTSDSDSGIRFKTTSTRYKTDESDKYSPSTGFARLVSSNKRHSHDNDREKDRYKKRDSNHTSRRSRTSSRSKSRSRSRDQRKRKEKEHRSHRSRSRSRSKRSSHSRRERKNSSDNIISSSHTQTIVLDKNTDEQSKSVQNRILDISVSSLSSQDEHIGKEEVSENYFGPALPPTMQNSEDKLTDNECGEGVEKTDEFGPALPPDLANKHLVEETQLSDKNLRIIGPALPSNTQINTEPMESSESELSPFSEEEQVPDDEDLIGPLPGGSSSRMNVELEQRALEIKLNRFNEPKNVNVTSREDWMLKLPDVRKVSDMGLGARQFRTREKQDIGDRTVWTDTPSDKERKKSSSSSIDTTRDRDEEQERRRIAERDRQQEEMVKKHKKKHKRDKSLLDIHKKKLEEKKKQDTAEPTRRPFDRNVDLHANRFDEAQKKAIFKKAQLLDTRFSSGASKFL